MAACVRLSRQSRGNKCRRWRVETHLITTHNYVLARLGRYVLLSHGLADDDRFPRSALQTSNNSGSVELPQDPCPCLSRNSREPSPRAVITIIVP